MSSEDLERAREQLRRACEDGERLYRKRKHDEPTIADDNRIDGILTYDLTAALGTVDTLLAALAVAREREQRLREAAEVVVGEWHADNPFVGVRIEVLEDALVDEPAAAGAGHNLCACGSTLIVCAKCGDSRCLVCDPYDELDTCGATEPAAATMAEPGGIGGSEATGATTAAGRRVATPGFKTDASSPGSASAAADEPGETP